MSDRQKVQLLIHKEFKNILERNRPSGYCYYIFKSGDDYQVKLLTTGVFNAFAIPPKYYESPEEMFNDICQYFNPLP